MDELDFLNPGESPEPTAAANIEPAEAPVEQSAEPQGQPRGPDGKFAPKAEAAPAPQAPEPSPAPAPVASAAEQPKIPDGYVPVSALQALRDEIRALKQAPQPSPPRLEPGDEGFEEQQHWEAVRATASAETRIALATEYAIEKHGEEKVQAALAWARERAETDPVFRAQSWTAKDPVTFAIQEQQRHEGMSFAANLFADQRAREQFQAWLNGQAPAPQQPAAHAPLTPEPPTPPRSLASAPAAGGDKPGAIPVHEGAAFDATFTR